MILVGFGPFGKSARNISSEIVKKIKLRNSNFQLIKKILPVSWKQSIDSYNKLLLSLKAPPKLVILLGVHSNKQIHINKYGWNIAFGKDIDNRFKFGMIKYSFPFRIKTILNIKKIYSILKDKMDISISNYAGIYLCNYIYYWGLYFSDFKYPVVFIHIPEIADLNLFVKLIKKILKTIIKIHFNVELKI